MDILLFRLCGTIILFGRYALRPQTAIFGVSGVLGISAHCPSCITHVSYFVLEASSLSARLSLRVNQLNEKPFSTVCPEGNNIKSYYAYRWLVAIWGLVSWWHWTDPPFSVQSATEVKIGLNHEILILINSDN